MQRGLMQGGGVNSPCRGQPNLPNNITDTLGLAILWWLCFWEEALNLSLFGGYLSQRFHLEFLGKKLLLFSACYLEAVPVLPRMTRSRLHLPHYAALSSSVTPDQPVDRNVRACSQAVVLYRRNVSITSVRPLILGPGSSREMLPGGDRAGKG